MQGWLSKDQTYDSVVCLQCFKNSCLAVLLRNVNCLQNTPWSALLTLRSHLRPSQVPQPTLWSGLGERSP